MTVSIGFSTRVPFAINQTDLLAGTSAELIAPMDGYVVGVETTIQAAVTTGGVVKVAKGDTPTDIAGLSITVANSATKGTRQTATATKGSTTRKVAKGDRVQVIPSAAFDVAGAVSGNVVFASAVVGEELPV